MISRYTSTFLFASISSLALSQDIHNNNMIFVPEGTSLHVRGFSNRGFLQNNGTIELTGDWSNHWVYQGLGMISLSGDDQNFDNNNQAVENLLIDGGGNKSITGTLTVNGSLDLVSGVIKVDRNDELSIDVEGAINGGSASSFVDGPLTIEGSGYKFFPVGYNGSYYPITLTDIQGLDPIIQVSAFENLPDVTTSRNIEVDQHVYWTQKKVGGTYHGSPMMVQNPFDDDPERIAFVSGDDLRREFDVIGNNGKVNEIVTSEDPIEGSIIAIGKLPGEPVKPGYLSTTLSPHALNPDNRMVKIFGSNIGDTNFSFRIFNRFGSLLFESTSLSAMTNTGWDGRSNGQIVSAGAYPYKLSYVDHEGREGFKTGFITVIY